MKPYVKSIKGKHVLAHFVHPPRPINTMTTPNDSDPAPSEQARTPETDAEVYVGIAYPNHITFPQANQQQEVVTAAFARSLERRLRAQSAELEQHKTRIGIQAGRIAALESERNGLLSELEQARAVERELRASCGDAGRLIESCADKLDALKAGLAATTARLAERESQVAELVRDKERLDFMESCISTKTAFAFDEELFDKQGLRAAIDAAISKPQP